MIKDIKLVCFDLDGTLIKDNSWYSLNIALGITPEEDSEMLQQYSSGDLTYSAWTEKLVALYKKHGLATKENIIKALHNYTLLPGAHEVVANLKNKGYKIVLIPGSFDTLAAHVAKELGIEYSKGNTSVVYDENDMLENVISDGEEVYAKLEHLVKFSEQLNIPLTECTAVGDGENDLEIFKATKHGITFKGASIEPYAWKTIDSLQDLNTIL